MHIVSKYALPKLGGKGRTRTYEVNRRGIYSPDPLPLGSLSLNSMKVAQSHHRLGGYITGLPTIPLSCFESYEAVVSLYSVGIQP